MQKLLFLICIASGFVALFLLFLAGPSYRFGILELGSTFTMMKVAAGLGVASVILAIVYGLWRQPRGLALGVVAASGIAGAIAFSIPFGQYQTARSAPRIHDISTDLENPPQFIDIAPLRRDAPNPITYAGEETAEQQRRAYPGIQTQYLEYPLKKVYKKARKAAKIMGWDTVSSVHEGDYARIEATDTTLWYGFKDDVVIRMQQEDGTVVVDVRSKSRIGKSDLGVNAERVQEFIDLLNEKMARVD